MTAYKLPPQHFWHQFISQLRGRLCLLDLVSPIVTCLGDFFHAHKLSQSLINFEIKLLALYRNHFISLAHSLDADSSMRSKLKGRAARLDKKIIKRKCDLRQRFHGWPSIDVYMLAAGLARRFVLSLFLLVNEAQAAMRKMMQKNASSAFMRLVLVVSCGRR